MKGLPHRLAGITDTLTIRGCVALHLYFPPFFCFYCVEVLSVIELSNVTVLLIPEGRLKVLQINN